MRPAKLPLVCLLSAVLALPGCVLFSDSPHYRGIAVTASELSQLTPGVSTEADAQALIGPPTVEEQFAPNNWIYVSQITKMRIARTEGVQKQHVVVLTFDDNGVLQSISQKGTGDAVNVAMDDAETPVPGGKASFVQQLIGGTGYNPLGSLGLGGTSGNATGVGGLGGGGLGGASSDTGAAAGGGGGL